MKSGGPGNMRCFLQDGFYPKDKELRLRALLKQRGMETVLFPPAASADLPTDPWSPTIASIDVKLRMLERAGRSNRILADYPDILRPLMGRRHWQGGLGDLLDGPAAQEQPIFVKTPLPRWTQPDAFASRIVDSLQVVSESPITSADTPVICAEAISWIAEWRTYVFAGSIVDIFLYSPSLDRAEDATPKLMFDTALIEDAVRLMNGTPNSPIAYALDFGVLPTGQTTLIEANDAIALANYGLPDAVHLDLHIERWQELMRG